MSLVDNDRRFFPEMHVSLANMAKKMHNTKQHLLSSDVKYCVHTCMQRCEELQACKGHRTANNLAETAQDGNNGTMNSKVSNPC